jgi:PAS domain S-box-containing protein
MERSEKLHGSQSERRFRRLVEMVDGVIPWEIDPATWRFIYVGPQAVKLLGYPLEEWYEEGFWRQHVHPEDRDDALQTCMAATARSEDHELYYRMIAADGRVVWFRDITSVVWTEDGSKLLEGFLVDITESRRVAESLQQAHDRLEQRVEERTAELRKTNERLQEQIAERLRAENALRESEERYRFLVENAPDFILMLDLEGKVLVLNRAAPGFRTEQLVGTSLYEFTPAESQHVLRDALERVVRTGRVVSYEILGFGADGAPTWYACRMGPIRRYGQIAAVIIVATDVHERLRTEAALRESEQRYRALAESSAVGIWHVLLEGQTIYVNPSMCALLEIDGPEDLADRTFHGFFTPESLQTMAVEHAKRAQGIASSYEVEMISKLGRKRSLVISGAPVYGPDGAWNSLIGTFTDITERKRAEEALRESEDRFRTLIQDLNVGVLLQGPAAEILLSNRAALELLGLTESQLLGKSSFDPDWNVIHEDGSPFLGSTHPVPQAIATRKPVHNVLMGVYRPSRRDRIWLLVNAEPQLGPDGSVRRVICTFNDVTERLRAEEERRQLEAQIQHTQKLESLGVLAGGIAHDFNNLLMGILGNVGLVLMEMPTEAPGRSYIQTIESVALHAAELTNQMLAYSGKGKFVVRSIDLSRLIKEMTHLLEMVTSKKVTLRFSLASPLPLVEADAAQLRQVILNLVTNASEAIGEQTGLITVSTGTVEAGRALLAATYLEEDLPEGTYVYVEVSDTGCGMDEATQARIFDPFFTTKFTGRGLGLAAVLGIVRGHRGAIQLESKPGRGTTFRVLLPGAQRQLETPPERGALKSETARAGAMILVVDDEQIIRDLVGSALERFGFRVLTAADGCEAVEVFAAHAAEIDAVLLDMTMPRMGGEETFRELRRIRPDVRVVLSSGYGEQEAAERFAGAGLGAFIQKPYQPQSLVETLRRVLD